MMLLDGNNYLNARAQEVRVNECSITDVSLQHQQMTQWTCLKSFHLCKGQKVPLHSVAAYA